MTDSKGIISTLQSVSELLLNDDYYFFIPDFQRNFVWGKKEIDQLFHDFEEDTNCFEMESSDLDGYLLGNIVLISDGNKRIVVDGQQRLTTLSLISKAIYSVVLEKANTQTDEKEKNKWFMKLGDIQKGFCILNENDEFASLKIQHDQSLGFGKYFGKLMRNDNVSEDDIVSNDDSRVDEIYSITYEKLLSMNQTKLARFIPYFKTKVKLIVTSATSEAKAFQLFEILNARGRSLEPMDLIKNHFLKVLNNDSQITDDQIKQFTQDWKKVMDDLAIDSRNSISSTYFLKQYIITYFGENKKNHELFDYIKNGTNQLKSGSNILHFVSGMSKAAKHFKELETKDYSVFSISGDNKNAYIIFELLSLTQFHPLLMLFYSAPDEQKESVLDATMRLGASVVFSFSQTNNIESMLPEFIKSYHNDLNNNPESAFNNLITKLDEKTEIFATEAKNTIAMRNFSGRGKDTLNSKALIILKFIELYFNKNPLARYPKKRITAEHILSKKIDMTLYTNGELGFEDDKDRIAHKHRMGNLTLLYYTDNSSVGNKPFYEKTECYRNYDFILTSTLISPKTTTVINGQDTILFNKINQYEKQYTSPNGHWRKENIIQRSNDLSTLVYKLLTNSIDA